MSKGAIFNINKDFPEGELREFHKILVKFPSHYSVWAQCSLEPNILCKDIEFLARFKKSLFNGCIARDRDVFKIVFPEHIVTVVNISDSSVSFLNLNSPRAYKFTGSYKEELEVIPLTSSEDYLKGSNVITIDPNRFFDEVITHYKLETVKVNLAFDDKAEYSDPIAENNDSDDIYFDGIIKEKDDDCAGENDYRYSQ